MRLALLLVLLAPAVASAQTGVATNYAVTVAGDTLRSTVDFKNPLLGSSYVTVDGVRREISEFTFLYLDGVTNAVVDGRRLAPLMNEGRVRFYARTVTSPGVMTVGPNGQMLPTGGVSNRIGYIQTADGPVVKATNSALRTALGDNPESLRHLNRARTLRTAGWVGTGLGIAAFIGGAVLSFDAQGENSSTPQFSPVLIGGALLAGGSAYILPNLADSARDRAIDAYNAE